VPQTIFSSAVELPCEFRKAMFKSGICFCLYIRESEVKRMENIYNAEFIKWC